MTKTVERTDMQRSGWILFSILIGKIPAVEKVAIQKSEHRRQSYTS
jgi:hypothetical protein